ncbi:hypothetical protein ABQJ54_03135 [Rhodanobacter sp. Si-c]|uniref:Uncharacterized protein n=1 Tax=Rhodanobacter lycopersici TaxID=3162487 RepID=A0ABV3QAG5_9GAMM
MDRTNAVLLGLAMSVLLGANAVARDASPGSSSNFPQSAVSGAAQTQSGTVTNIPLLVVVTNKGQVRDIQHSLRLPGAVNNLLWNSVQGWVKSSARINGKRVRSQVYMDVILHAEPQADGKSNVYFTLASIGPVMRGYWRMHGDSINGPCSITGNMAAGVGGSGKWCTYKLTAGALPATAGTSSASNK